MRHAATRGTRERVLWSHAWHKGSCGVQSRVALVPGREGAVCYHAWYMGANMAATAKLAPATGGLRIRPWRAEAPARPPVREESALPTPGVALRPKELQVFRHEVICHRNEQACSCGPGILVPAKLQQPHAWESDL